MCLFSTCIFIVSPSAPQNSFSVGKQSTEGSQTAWVPTPVLPCSLDITLGQSFQFSVPQLPVLQRMDKKSAYDCREDQTSQRAIRGEVGKQTVV